MIQDIMKDEAFLAQKAEPATPDDLPVAQDLLDTLTANKDGCRDLYQFWGDRLARQLASETDFVLNLASKEYSKTVEPHLPESVRFLTCIFGEWKDGKVIEKGTQCKMVRGQMVRWMVENKIKGPENLRAFDQLGYRFREELSTENQYVFLTAPFRRARS